MSVLSLRDYENILHFISVIQDDRDDYRYRVLKYLSEIFTFNHLTFFLINDQGKFTSPLGLNISNNLFQMYAEYYFKTDIFHPINVSSRLMFNKNSFTITDLMSLKEFENTEYYLDFLKKDNLFYELALPLKAGKRLIGGVGIFRPKKEGDFTSHEREIIGNISHHISFHLNEYLETTQIKKERQIYKNCVAQLPLGLIVLDSNWSVVNSNEMAKIYCLDLLNQKETIDPINEVIINILPNISFQAMDSSTVIYNDFDSYSMKIVPSIVPNTYKGIETYYLLYLIKKTPDERNNLESLSVCYNLTNREVEIIKLIAQGLSNKEIADTLFLSVHTVRTHVDNIFNKLNVSSRTSILYKTGMIQDFK